MDDIETLAREFWGNLHKLSGPQDIVTFLSRDERALRIVEEADETPPKLTDEMQGVWTAAVRFTKDEIKRRLERRLEESDG